MSFYNLNDALSGNSEPSQTLYTGRYVPWPVAWDVTRGREREILGLAGVAYRVNGSDHINCPIPGHTDNHPSFRLIPFDDGSFRGICSQNCPVAYQPTSIFDLWAAIKGVIAEQAKLDIIEALGRSDLIIDTSSHADGLTLAQYAAEKQIPESFLRETFSLADCTYFDKSAVLVPYYDESRQFRRNRIRKAMKKAKGKRDNRFVWDDKKGVPTCLYGIWRIEEFKDDPLLVEGESDTQTGWYYGIPVFGLPGAGNFNEARDAPLLARYENIYALKEPDEAGTGLMKKLRQSRLAPRIRVVCLSDGIKDLSALHLHLLAKGTFRSTLWQAMQNAAPLLELPSAEPINEQRDELADLYDQFNQKYAVVKDGGKTLVFERVLDPMLDRFVMIAIRFSDFKNLYMNWRITKTYPDGRTVTRTAAEWWLEYFYRTQFNDGFVFDPTGKQYSGRWNLWSGFSVEPVSGDWSLLRNHLFEVICQRNHTLFDYVMNWTARLFQRPHKPGEVALVIRGDKGAGKGKFLNWIRQAWGQHGLQISNPEHLVGRFNNHLRDLVFLFADEAFFAADKKHEGVLKGLVTETILPIEPKFRDVTMVVNMLHIAMASNSDWVVPASSKERRYCVLDASGERIGNFAYFAAIDQQMENGGLAAMIHELLNRDIRQFEVRAFPQTDALSEQKAHSLDSLARWWLTVLERGFVYKSRHGAFAFAQWYEFAATELLWRSYLQWCNETRSSRPQSRVELGKMMAELYQRTRPTGSAIIGEVETLHPDQEQLKAGKGWVDQEAVERSDHVPGYAIGLLDTARSRFVEVRNVRGEW